MINGPCGWWKLLLTTLLTSGSVPTPVKIPRYIIVIIIIIIIIIIMEGACNMIINIQFMKNRCSPEKIREWAFQAAWKYHMNSVHTESTTWTQYRLKVPHELSTLKVPHKLSTHWKYHMNSVHTESTTWTQYTLKVQRLLRRNNKKIHNHIENGAISCFLCVTIVNLFNNN